MTDLTLRKYRYRRRSHTVQEKKVNGSPKCPYGPSKPHLGQRYGRPNFLQREHRHIMISPQFGHVNFVASAPGAIILWHEVHSGTVTVTAGFSLMMGFLCEDFE